MEVLTGGWEIFLFGGVFIRFGKKKKKRKTGKKRKKKKKKKRN